MADMARLAPVFHTIQAQYAQRLTLAGLAYILHVHPAYLCAYFKRVTGLAPLRFFDSSLDTGWTAHGSTCCRPA